MRIAAHVAALSGSMLIAGLAGCNSGGGGYGNTGIYVSASGNDAAMVQLIETPDHHVTGRLEECQFGPDGVIADDALMIDGTASGHDMTLMFHPSWITAGVSATARTDGNILHFALRNELMTLKRGTLEGHLADEKAVSDHAAVVAVRRAQAAMIQAQRDAAQRAHDDEVTRQQNALQNARDDEMNRQREVQNELAEFQEELRATSADLAKSTAALNNSRDLIDREKHEAPERTAAARVALGRALQTDAGSAPTGVSLLEAIGSPLDKAQHQLGELREFNTINSTKLANDVTILSITAKRCSDAKGSALNANDLQQISVACSSLIGEARSLEILRKETNRQVESLIGPLAAEIDAQKALFSEARALCARRRFC